MLATCASSALILLYVFSWASAQDTGEDAAAAVERGRYLVHQVAMCVVCHSPKDAKGNLQTLRLLQGGKIPVESPYPDVVWGFEAPQLAGLPGWEPDQVVTLLMTGRRPNGRNPRPPMPPFRMSESDARAVVAYLKSLE